MVLCETIELERMVRPQGELRQILAIAVPTSTSIPFNLMMDVPLPFSPNARDPLCYYYRQG